MSRTLEVGGLYVVIGMLAKDYTNYWTLLDDEGKLDSKVRTGLLAGEFDWLYYDLYLHKTEDSGTIYRISFKGVPQLEERAEGGTRLETEGEPHLEIRKDVKDMSNLTYIVALVKFFQLSPKVVERVESALTEIDMKQGGGYIPSTKVWSFRMLDILNSALQNEGYVTSMPGPINFPPFHQTVVNFARAHAESALRGEKPRPILNFASRRFSARDESA